MAISVTEYLGKRTDIDNPSIEVQSDHNNICPFNGKVCEKIIKDNKPVCSIRNFGRKRNISPAEYGEHPIWIVCENRLCSTRIKAADGSLVLTELQKNVLRQVANTVFSGPVDDSKLYIRSEVSVQVNENRRQDMHADFVMAYYPEGEYEGKKRLIVELQGGGETSNTGIMTEAVDNWEKNPSPTNAVLRSLISGVGTLQTNAWRRQQEQALVKSNVAQKTPNVDGFVLCMGDALFNYLEEKLKLSQLNCDAGEDWQVAVVTFKEDTDSPIVEGPIPLVVNRVIRISTYSRFVSAITDQGKSTPSAFTGEFISLADETRIF